MKEIKINNMKKVITAALILLISCTKNTHDTRQTEPMTLAVITPIMLQVGYTDQYDPFRAALTCMQTTTTFGACIKCAIAECGDHWKCAVMCGLGFGKCAIAWAWGCGFGSIAPLLPDKLQPFVPPTLILEP